MATPGSPHTKSEDIYGEKWDRCLSESAIKIAMGAGLGVVFSVIFFKRRPWPVVFGSGIGIGIGYANCQHDFIHPNLVHGRIKRVEANTKTEAKKE